MANRMTNVIALTSAIDTLTAQGMDPEVIAKLENIKASYEKKSSGTRKPTATQIANEALKQEIAAALRPGEKYTVTDIVKLLDGDYTNQKISALMRALEASGLVQKTVDKRKSFYSLVIA